MNDNVNVMAAFSLLSVFGYRSAAATPVRVKVQPRKVLNTFDAAFASITYDIQDFIGFKIYPWKYDWSNKQLETMIQALTPLTVRAGGTWEDGIFWDDGPKVGRETKFKWKSGMQSHNLTKKAWDPFMKFWTKFGASSARIVVGLNGLNRHWGNCDAGPDAECHDAIPWDSRNSEAFIKHNHEQQYNIYGYELGNEPGVWNWTWGTPIIPPRQHAADYAVLRNVLAQEHLSSSNIGDATPLVVGPDTTWGAVGDELPGGGRNPIAGAGGPNADYWNGTLQSAPLIDAAAFHYYALLPGLVRTWRDFVTIMRNRSMCTAVAAHARDLASSPLAGKVPLWLGEGGASYGGINSKEGDWLTVFGGALSYLEDLGCAASNGAKIFARQQLSNYIQGNVQKTKGTYRAFPAWWIAVLWKKLVGTTALEVTLSGGDASPLHVFAFGGTNANRTVSSVRVYTVTAVNWDEKKEVTMVIPGCTAGAEYYLLTPFASTWGSGFVSTAAAAPPNPVLQGGIAINGKEAKVNAEGSVPAGLLDALVVECVAGEITVEIPALSAVLVGNVELELQ